MATLQPDDRVPWLTMLYLAGDNKLTEEMVLALQDLVGHPMTESKIVAQLDPSGVGLETQRYVFPGPPGAKTLDDHRDTTFDPVEVDTGSVESLTDFVNWALSYAPIEKKMRFMLVLSGHGGGHSADFLMKDENAQNALSIPELREALTRSLPMLQARTSLDRKFDILGFDACFMSMGEVALEVRDYATILVGAEGMEPEFGWPYRRILAKSMGSGQHPTADELACDIVGEYVTHFSDYDRAAGKSTDLSAIRLENLQPLVDAFTYLVADLQGLTDKEHEQLVLAHWYAQTYKFDQYVDLRDLCTQIPDKIPRLAARCKAVGDALDPSGDAELSKPTGDKALDAANAKKRSCVLKTGCSGFAYQHSYGLSIYFPWAYVSPEYQELQFANANTTKWCDFLKIHIQKTQRKARFGKAVPAFSAPAFTAPHTAAPAVAAAAAEPTRFDRLMAVKEMARATLAQAGGGSGRRAMASSRAASASSTTSPPTATAAAPTAAVAASTAVERAIKQQFLKVLSSPSSHRLDASVDIDTRLNQVIKFLAEADILDEDIPCEIGRRFVRSSAVVKGRYDDSKYDDSKYDQSRSPEDREHAIKNLAPTIGKAFLP